ncbi:MAG: DUF294 nucleotidyltransferase-like domain-containing protein [Bacteroidota bacterium]
MLKPETLQRISEYVVIQHHKAGDYIFQLGESPKEYLYVVRDGAVEIIQPETNVLVEYCDEGDLFGLRPIIANEAYLLSAKAAEESLIYAIPAINVQQVIESNPKVGYYLAQQFASGISNKYTKMYKGRLFLEKDLSVLYQNSLFEIQSVQQSKKPITCTMDYTIQEAAKKMQANSVGSIIIVNEKDHPMGIITDRDLRNRVVTGELSRKEPVHKVMSSPVVTVEANASVARVQIMMMRHRIHHLCITADGTDKQPVLGILSEHDLLVLQGNNPAILIRETKRSKNAEELREIRAKGEQLLQRYLEREVAIDFIADVMTEINDALIHRVIDLSITTLEAEGQSLPSDVAWSWWGLGSEGRGEQLLRTDQDNALIFADVPDEQLEATRAQFLRLAEKVTAALHQAGFAYCPGEMMASNPRWCLSKQEWKDQFSEWILTPTAQNILHCNIFFDYRSLYGDAKLAAEIGEHIYTTIDQKGIFLSLLAKNTLQNPPPLTFFRNFVIEKDGKHKDAFNIKARAMMPLTDAARVLILGHKVSGINNTFRRFEKLAELEPNYKELYKQAADAYEILIRYRALQGLKNGDTGQFLNPADLSKMQRLNLRNSFTPIRELQEIIGIRYRVSFFN